MAELLEPKLKDRSGAGVQATLVAGSFRASSPTLTHVLAFSLEDGIPSGESFPVRGSLPVVTPAPVILTFVTTDAGANYVSTWTTQDEAIPATLTGYYIYGSADGGQFTVRATFDADERTSSWGKPGFVSTFDMYLVGHNAATANVTLLSGTLSFTP